MIIETLLDLFGKTKKILKNYKSVHIGVKGLLGSSTKKNKNNTK